MAHREGTIKIEYGAVENGNKQAGGWLPALWINGKRHGSTFATRGHDRDAALALAREDAGEERQRYVGDWTITIDERPRRQPGEIGGIRAALRRRPLGESIAIDYGTHRVFQQYWWGQGDPLYAVLSRRGGSVSRVTVDASPAEIDRMCQVAEEILERGQRRGSGRVVPEGSRYRDSYEAGGDRPGAGDLRVAAGFHRAHCKRR